MCVGQEERGGGGRGKGERQAAVVGGAVAVAVAALFINRPHLCRQRCNGFGN